MGDAADPIVAVRTERGSFPESGNSPFRYAAVEKMFNFVTPPMAVTDKTYIHHDTFER